ncbi:IS630 family transposase [Sorangium sp. So ce429]
MPRARAKPVLRPTPLRQKLQHTARSPKTSQRDAQRARIALLADEGWSNEQIQRAVACDIKTVRKWRNRIAALADEAVLQDRARTGRPPRVATAVHYELINLACSRPDEHKVPFERVWTLDRLAKTLKFETEVELSRTEVWRVLQGASLRPHRVRLRLHSPDPDFRPKAEAICKLYLEPPAGATVLCVDEKTGTQALEHRFPMQPCRSRKAARREFEYQRHGTLTLLGAFNVKTGEVVSRCGPTRTAVDLLAFMDEVAERYPTGDVYIIWDNLNIHHGARWNEFNARHGRRFHFVYTPIHASWVNQIELWFSVLSRRVLKHASFASVEELSRCVLGFVRHWNEHEARPFRWRFRGQWRATLPSYAA